MALAATHRRRLALGCKDGPLRAAAKELGVNLVGVT
jgi:hypothetical protein